MSTSTTRAGVLNNWESNGMALSAAGLIVGQIPGFSDIYGSPEDYLKSRDQDYYTMYGLTDIELGLVAAAMVIHNEFDCHNGMFTRISSFVVDRANRGNKYGRTMIHHIAEQSLLCHDPCIVVAPAKSSTGFYRRVGFTKNAHWRGDYDATPQTVLAH